MLHFLQYKEKGRDAYVSEVAIPSITINILDRIGRLRYDDYGAPWEADADRRGGVVRTTWNTPWPDGAYNSHDDLFKMFFD